MTNVKKLPPLPKGWLWTQIQDISETTSGGTPSRKNKDFFSGKIPWLKSGELADNLNINSAEEAINQQALDNSSAKIIPKGSLLVALYGATVGKLGLLTIDAAINQAICAIQPYQGVFPKYLFYYLSSYRKNFLNARKGGAQPNISQEIVKLALVPLAPTAEQLGIISKVEELFSFLDAGAESRRKGQAQLKRYRQAVLKYAFEGKLTEEWRKTHKDRAMPNRNLLKDNTPDELLIVSSPFIQKLPEEWFWIKLSKISDSMKNGIYRPSSFYADEGFACLRMYNIEKGSIVWKDIKRMKLKREEIEEYGLKPGDILVNRVNSRELVGKSAVIPESLEPCVYESKNIRLRLINQLADSKYVAFWILYYGQKYFNRNAQQTVGMASINQEQLGSMLIPFCSLLEQQLVVQEIERHFSVADASENAVFSCLKLTERLRQSVLKKAFEGELVPQNPNDEPAERLLLRIKNEHSGNKSKVNGQLELSRYVK